MDIMKGKMYTRCFDSTYKKGPKAGMPVSMVSVLLEVKDVDAMSDEEFNAVTKDDVFNVSFVVNETDRAYETFKNASSGNFYSCVYDKLTSDGFYTNCVNPHIRALSTPEYLAPSTIIEKTDSGIVKHTVRG